LKDIKTAENDFVVLPQKLCASHAEAPCPSKHSRAGSPVATTSIRLVFGKKFSSTGTGFVASGSRGLANFTILASVKFRSWRPKWLTNLFSCFIGSSLLSGAPHLLIHPQKRLACFLHVPCRSPGVLDPSIYADLLPNLHVSFDIWSKTVVRWKNPSEVLFRRRTLDPFLKCAGPWCRDRDSETEIQTHQNQVTAAWIHIGGKAGGQNRGKRVLKGQNKPGWTTAIRLKWQERPIKLPAHNPKVGGSNPSPAIRGGWISRLFSLRYR